MISLSSQPLSPPKIVTMWTMAMRLKNLHDAILKEITMYISNLHISLAPLVSLICGILILIVPRLLNYIIAIYLIVIGIIGLTGGRGIHI